MPAYVIISRKGPIRDEAEYAEYQRIGQEAPRDPKMQPLVIYGALQPLEGAPPDGVVMLQFPTLEDAKAWYGGPGYQKALPHRLAAGDWSAFIVEGL